MNHCLFRNAAIRRHARSLKTRTNPNLLLFVNGESPYADRSVYNRGLVAPNAVTLVTENPKFGAQCYRVTMTSSWYNQPRAVLGTVWTIDFWLRLFQPMTSSQQQFMYAYGDYPGGFSIHRPRNTSEINDHGIVKFFFFPNNSSERIGCPIGTCDTDAWVHMAITSDGSHVRTFYNGRLRTVVQSATPIANDSTTFRQTGTGDCVVDEFRILRDECVWRSNFTPPTAPYTGTERYPLGR